MADETLISWADMTFNPWVGCTRVSPACDGCYAAHLMETRMGRVQWGGPCVGAGTRERTSVANWRKPLAWNKKAAKDGTKPFVFCSSLADVFDNEIPTEWRRDLFELIIKTPNLIWLLLTKRPQNIVKLFDAVSHVRGEWPKNAAIGTTVEDQKRFDLNVPALRKAKRLINPAFAFLSCEPLLGPLSGSLHDIDWVITGGETDQGAHKARPTHPEWFRSLRRQAEEAGAAFHHKQNGEWMPLQENDGEWPTDQPGFCRITTTGERADDGWPMQKVGKKFAGRMLDGVTHDAFPQIGGAS